MRAVILLIVAGVLCLPVAPRGQALPPEIAARLNTTGGPGNSNECYLCCLDSSYCSGYNLQCCQTGSNGYCCSSSYSCTTCGNSCCLYSSYTCDANDECTSNGGGGGYINVPLIAGVIAAGVIIFFVGVIVVCCVQHQKRRARLAAQNAKTVVMTSVPAASVTMGATTTAMMVPQNQPPSQYPQSSVVMMVPTGNGGQTAYASGYPMAGTPIQGSPMMQQQQPRPGSVAIQGSMQMQPSMMMQPSMSMMQQPSMMQPMMPQAISVSPSLPTPLDHAGMQANPMMSYASAGNGPTGSGDAKVQIDFGIPPAPAL